MNLKIYYKDKISIDFKGITKIVLNGMSFNTQDGIEEILQYIYDKTKYSDIGIRYMNNTIIPSPVEFNQIIDNNIKQKIMAVFQELNKHIEFINEIT